jgi:parallel beta-helix repeat protein
MDPQIIAAIIGGAATVVGAVIATVLGIRAGRRRGGTESGGMSSQVDPPHSATASRQGSGGPATKQEPHTHIVDPAGVEGDFATISEAIRAAAPKDKILVRPGWYREGLVVDKPLDIAGDGNSEDIVVRSDGESALWFSATAGRVSNMTLRQVNREAQQFAVTISLGRLTLTDCDISNRSLAGVGVYDGANPTLRNNRIHDNNQSGVLVYNNGLGVLEDNDIFANGNAGVSVSDGGDPVVHHNRIHDGKMSGVNIKDGGKGTLEDNDIFANAYAGVQIRGEGSDPTVRDNRIHDNKQGGVNVFDGGKGTLEGNDIFNNTVSGVQISGEGSDPMLSNNRIHDNKQKGVLVIKGGKGTLEENDICANADFGVLISDGGSPTVRNNRINKHKYGGVYVHK